MNTVTNRNFLKISSTLLALLFCWTGTSFAVEVSGGPFTYDAGSNDASRSYSGTVSPAQNTLVAYERNVQGPSTCSNSGYSVADLTTSYSGGTQALHGTVTFTTAPLQILDAIEDDGGGCIPGPWDAGAIYYEAFTGYSGTDSFQMTLVGGDIITVNITITAPTETETGGVATITPILLQTSVKQTSSMISDRIKRVIIPRTLFKDRTAPTGPQQGQPAADDDETASLSLDEQQRALTDILNVTLDSKTIGISAGDASMKHGIWTNIAYTSADDDNTATDSSMDINTYIVGYDYKISDSMAMGVAVTYEKIQADLDFNNGDLDGDGYTIAPYFAMLLTDYLAMDIIAGYAIVEYDQDRDFGAVKSSVDADRQFLQFSLNGFHYIDQWSINGHMSFLYAHEGQDSYTESDNTNIKSNNVDFSQLSAGIEVAYGFKHIEPYVTIAYEYDTQYEEITDASYDRNGGDGGVGCRFFFSEQLSGDLYGSTKFGRDDYDEYSVLGNIRYDF